MCLKASANKFARYVQKGIPELEIAEVRTVTTNSTRLPQSQSDRIYYSIIDPLQVEPVLIDEIGIVLGSGPDGYRATFKNLEAFGVSNLTISNIR